ncbi:unnamed protein product [Peniophora sp. CBMAI 1063]|nr:unnamed protein product [Peniophora sp. CBMAI 1063]
MSLFCLSFSPSAPSSVLDIKPAKVAQQLTLLEWERFSKIEPNDIPHNAYNLHAREPKATASEIHAVLDMSNKIKDWVIKSVLEEKDATKRARLIEHFISILDECRKQSNISSMYHLYTGLSSSPIKRLTQTWALVRHQKQYTLFACMDWFRPVLQSDRYEEVHRGLKAPCVPYLGFYLSNIGLRPQKTRCSDDEIVREIRALQGGSYKFDNDERIRNFICGRMTARVRYSEDVKIYMDKSCKLE